MTGILSDMLGKSVTLDGVKVGYATQIEIEQRNDSYPVLRVELVMDEQTIDNLREYVKIMEVMG